MSTRDSKNGTKNQAENSTNQLLTDEELDLIAAAGIIRGNDDTNFIQGTDGNDRIYGYGGTDILDGGEGNDTIIGGDGNDALFGGDGNDILDGGDKDGADDVASGGAGDDSYLWRVANEGNDTFHGDEGNDTIKLWDLGPGTLESVWAAGNFNISLEDENGHEIAVTEDMFSANGNLILPPGCSGVITGPQGETLTFDGVEMITKHSS